MARMTDGMTVSLLDGTKAQLKSVQVSSWQTLLIAVLPPEPQRERPAAR